MGRTLIANERPSEELVEQHVRRIRDHLGRSGTWIVAWRKIDPGDQVAEAAARDRLRAALRRLNAEQQSACQAAGTHAAPIQLRWGDAVALNTRAQYYARALLVPWHVACVLATTPLPVSWVAHALDQLQLRTINARVQGRHSALMQEVWALLALAADGLTGTGHLPAPPLASRWCGAFLPMTAVPAVSRVYRAGDRDDQEARILRQAYWDAAEGLAGGSHDAGGMPVERYVPEWDLRRALHVVTGVDWYGSSGRRFCSLMRRVPWHNRYGRTRSDDGWRRAMLNDTASRLAAQVPGWRPSGQTSKAGHMRRWFLAPDLAQRCRWRALTLAGEDGELAKRLERRLLRDALDRYVMGTKADDETVLPAQAAWWDALTRSAWPSRIWITRPDVANGSIAHLVRLGYTPGRLRRDPGLRDASADDLAVAAELTRDRAFP